MSILHTLKGKLRSCRRQQDAVLQYFRDIIAPPLLAREEQSPFQKSATLLGHYVPISELTVSTEVDHLTVVGWSYVRWRHFIAHILIVGWPKFTEKAIWQSSRHEHCEHACMRCFHNPRLLLQGFVGAIRDTELLTYRQLTWIVPGFSGPMLQFLHRIFRNALLHTWKSSPVSSDKHRMNDRGRGRESSTIARGACV